MQAPSSIQDFPHSPPSHANSKRHFELGTEFLETAKAQQQQQQQQQQEEQNQDMFNDEQPPSKRQKPGVRANIMYKFTELAAYTTFLASEAYQTITSVAGVGVPTGGVNHQHPFQQEQEEQPPQQRQRTIRQIQQEIAIANRYSLAVDGYGDDVMQIKADGEESEIAEDDYMDEIDEQDEEDIPNASQVDSKKPVCDWSNLNADEEEPPPPYDNSWSIPSSGANASRSTVRFAETPSQDQCVTSQPQTAEPTNQSQPQQIPHSTGNARRRQFRVRRGRPIRRKSSSNNIQNVTSAATATATAPAPAAAATTAENTPGEGEDDVFLKFNCKLADMIAEGQAALKSTVDVTEVEMMIAEEHEREERIRRELGIQAPVGRRSRRLTSSSSDSDHFNPGSCPGPTADYGFGSKSGNTSGSESPTGYSTPGGYSSTPGYSTSPTQYGSSPNGFGATSSLFGGSTLGSTLSSFGNNNISRAFASNLGSSTAGISGGFGSGGISAYGGSASHYGMYGSNSTMSGITGGFGGPSLNLGSGLPSSRRAYY